MNPDRLAALQAAGAVPTTAAEFFGLSEAEEKVIEFRTALARQARQLRKGKGLTQREMAALLDVAQSRIPLIERGQASLEAIARAVVILGGSLIAGQMDRSARVMAKRRNNRPPRSTGPVVRPRLMAKCKSSHK